VIPFGQLPATASVLYIGPRPKCAAFAARRPGAVLFVYPSGTYGVAAGVRS